MEKMNKKERISTIIDTIMQFYPAAQAIYLFGSHDTEKEWTDSDIDIAILLPPGQAQKEKTIAVSSCKIKLEELLKKKVDLVNIRTVSTVFQKEIIFDNRAVYVSNQSAVDEFEMLVFSYYQKLNEERREILQEIEASSRIIDS